METSGPSLLAIPLPHAAASHEEEEDDCPVCYESCPPTRESCEVCKHAVCGICDTMMTRAGHERCPMCRARRPVRVHMVMHAFLCTDTACGRAKCTDAKGLLLQIKEHANQGTCAARELEGSDGCRVCKLWRALVNSRQDPTAAENMFSHPELLRARMRELTPAQINSRLISHARQCRNRRCETCRKLSELFLRVRAIRKRNRTAAS